MGRFIKRIKGDACSLDLHRKMLYWYVTGTIIARWRSILNLIKPVFIWAGILFLPTFVLFLSLCVGQFLVRPPYTWKGLARGAYIEASRSWAWWPVRVLKGLSMTHHCAENCTISTWKLYIFESLKIVNS